MPDIKILLVEDDDLFRSIIKKSLLKTPCEVVEAPNGKIAKEKILLNKFDLVISDIQMPHFSGIDLLEWIKKNHPTPVILMTGFSHALEARHADEIGADDFLAKPFKEAELHAVIEKYLVRTSAPVVFDTDLDKNFCRISLDNFLSEKETEVDIYIRISNAKYIKISHVGGKISEDRIKIYKERGTTHVYVKKEDFPKIVKFNLQVAKVAKNSSLLLIEKKTAFMRHTGDLILENTYVNGLNKESFLEAKDFIGTSIDILAEDQRIMTTLEILSTHTDSLYAHSLGVSVFSVMIGRQLGWTSAQTLFKLALGGLFHDIGKKEIPREILEKPRLLLTQEERSVFESHATRGKEILDSIGGMPSEVVMIAAQHHEDMLGQGYPRGISKNDIQPLAKVVQLANLFCEYAIKNGSDTAPISAQASIAVLEKLRPEAIDKDSFKALKQIFK